VLRKYLRRAFVSVLAATSWALGGAGASEYSCSKRPEADFTVTIAPCHAIAEF